MNNQDQMHPEDMRNLVLFIFLSVVLWLGYDHFVLGPRLEAAKQAKQAQIEAVAAATTAYEDIERPREVVVGSGPRIAIDTPAYSGSINLRGGRIDDILLKNYFRKAEGKDPMQLLTPAGTPYPRYVEFGWLGGIGAMPDKNTLWAAKGRELSPGNPVTLSWNNAQGLRFENTIAVDDDFLFTVTQRVTNTSAQSTTVFPYTLVTEHGLPEDHIPGWIVHEGPLGYIGGELHETSYKDIPDTPQQEFEATAGWAGITEKYWLTAIVPVQGEPVKYRFSYTPAQTPAAKARYQTDIAGAPRTLAPGEHAEVTTHIFSGAKKMDRLEHYEETLKIPHFDLAVDFGLFYFLTRPFFWLIHALYTLVGNFGIAIILFTVLLRLAVFPLANTSFRSFAKLRQVGPQMYELREKYGQDKQKLQEELVKLYQREKVNPMAGCLPILIQIPIFFALYKVLSNTIEMRHQPFFGWIQDLSAPDPTTVFNLFGILPYNVPEFLMIGAWPCLMLLTQLAQQRLSPPPQDPVQAKLIAFMPYFITFILAKFASGLVIYWTFNNLLSIVQQYVIMRRMGVEVSFFRKDRQEKKLEEAVAHGPSVHPEAELIEEKVEDALFGDDGRAPRISPPKPRKKKKK